MRWMSALLASAVLTFAVVIGLHFIGASATEVTVASGGSSATLDPRIAALADRHPGRSVEAIVQFSAGVSRAQAAADAARVNGRVVGELHIINGLAVKLTAARARTLAANPDVHSVSLNATVAPSSTLTRAATRALTSKLLPTAYARALGATSLWRAGLTGEGVGVAVVDTGIDGDLSDFRGADGHSRVVQTAVTNAGATTLHGDGARYDVRGATESTKRRRL